MDKIHVNNSDYMEFIDMIATQMTEMAYIDTDGSCIAYEEVQFFPSDDTCLVFTDEAQDFYNDKYNEVETMLNITLKVYSYEV